MYIELSCKFDPENFLGDICTACEFNQPNISKKDGHSLNCGFINGFRVARGRVGRDITSPSFDLPVNGRAVGVWL